MDFNTDGILLYAKQSGMTSFTSLGVIKRSLNTTKIGHTGTLDNFADGLLVVLVNRVRKISAQITDFDKTYEAIIRFGTETDTFDRDGKILTQSDFPSEEAFRAAARSFVGSFDQMPPLYSAIQVQGRRASDLVRQGCTPELKPRPVTIHSLDVLDFTGEYAHIRVHCSKGTYIRSLARDIASACGSCAHLHALRRTSCGPFTLENAAGVNLLPVFTIDWYLKNPPQKTSPSNIIEVTPSEICKSVLPFTANIARSCGFTDVYIKPEQEKGMLFGWQLDENYFDPVPTEKNAVCAVFSARDSVADGRFCGIVEKEGKRFSYRFVIQDEYPHPSPVGESRKNKPNVLNKEQKQQ